MAEPGPRPTSAPFALLPALLVGAGLVYLALGLALALVFLVGGIQSSLFPTGWLFPAVLIISGALMVARRRFDIVATLWAGLTLAVFMLGVIGLHQRPGPRARRCRRVRRGHHRGRLRVPGPAVATGLPHLRGTRAPHAPA